MNIILLIATFIGVPVVSLVLGRPLLPAIALSWGYWLAMWMFLLMRLGAYLATIPEDQRRTWEQMGAAIRALPVTRAGCVKAFILGFCRGFTLGMALAWGGLP